MCLGVVTVRGLGTEDRRWVPVEICHEQRREVLESRGSFMLLGLRKDQQK